MPSTMKAETPSGIRNVKSDANQNLKVVLYDDSDNPLKTGSVFEEMYTESDLDESGQITFEEDMSECEVVNMDDGDGLDFSVGDKDVSLEAKNVDTNGLPNLYHINETFPAFTVVDFSDTTTPTFIMIVRK